MFSNRRYEGGQSNQSNLQLLKLNSFKYLFTHYFWRDFMKRMIDISFSKKMTIKNLLNLVNTFIIGIVNIYSYCRLMTLLLNVAK